MTREIIIFVLVSATLFLFPGCERMETKENDYSNYDSITKSGEPGNWIPTFIPRSAVKIKERHKIDTGAVALIFNFRSHRDLSLDGVCEEVKPGDVLLPNMGFLNLSWWPASLYRDISNIEYPSQYKFFCCERQSFLAVRQIDDYIQAYYWRISLTDENAWGCKQGQ